MARLFVQQDDVELLRTIRLTGLPGAVVHGVVAGQRLARAGGAEQRQEQRQVFHFGQNLFDSHEGDVHLRQSAGQPGVALVFRDGDHPGFRHGEIRSADADVSRNIFVAQHPLRGHGQFRRIVGRRTAEFLLEERADLAPCQVHRGENEMVRRLFAQLHDVLTQVRLGHLETGGLQGGE